ncbi:MAG: hypothetical protein ACYDA1_03470 [Vulcanimicrobiaceae bacterium]
MKLPVAGVLLALIAMSGCGGGGGSSSGNSLPKPSATPTPTSTNAPLPTASPAAPGSYTVHIISLVAGVSTTSVGVFPVANPSLPAGQTLGSPAANAVITYPDGTSQVAGANGFFQAAASSYVQSHAQVIQTNPSTIPYVRVSDATGSAQPGSANVVAVSASASSNRIVGITVAPAGSEIFATSSLLLVAQGTSVDDLVAAPGSTITWSDTAGGTFTPVGSDTTQQIFMPPASANSGTTTTTDTITASMTAPGAAKPYTATAQIAILPTSQAATVSGTVSGSIANASADFILNDTSHLFPSYNFLGLADANGNYSVTLPANQQFAAAILAPGNTSQSFIAATINGSNSYQSGSAASSSTGIDLAPLTTSEDDTRDDASYAAPDPIVSVRDAWQAAMLLTPAPWWADSGVLGVLGASSTTTQAPAAVGSGLLADWCYQWTTSGGSTSLALIENTTASCASTVAPGNVGYVITPQGALGTFSYVEYRSISGAYTIGSSLAPANNAVLVATGQWTQTLAQSGSVVTSDTANVTQTLFGPTSHIASSGLSQAAFTYNFANAAVSIGNLTWIDPVSSLPLGSSTSLLLASTATPSSCVGSSQPCYSVTGTINRTYGLATGPVQVPYTLTDTMNGDGSSTTTLVVANGQAHTIFPIAAATQRAAGSCVVCTPNVGLLFDTDGNSQIGSYTVDAQQYVTYQLLGTSEGQGGTIGTMIGTRIFGL